jgi:hypothetical protein
MKAGDINAAYSAVEDMRNVYKILVERTRMARATRKAQRYE